MNTNKKVLALKYRPQTFKDLIGQEVVAETISNSIKAKKVPKKHLEQLESLAEKNNVSIKSQIITSKSVVNDIVNYAKSSKYDLVVIGSYGRTGFDKLLLGSVANGVSQKTQCLFHCYPYLPLRNPSNLVLQIFQKQPYYHLVFC